MGKDQTSVASSSKTEKTPYFRFSQAGKAFLKDYFHNSTNAPKKKERQQILANLKEIGDTEVTDLRISNWFNYHRQKERRRPSLPPPASASEQTEKKVWVDARHKALWPSIAKESFENLEELYNQHVELEGTAEPPYDLWAEGLDAKPEHVRRWYTFKKRQSTRQSQPGSAPTAEISSQMADERSQLPTPGNSTSPEPPTSTACLPPSPDAIKYEPPVSPVAETTRFSPPSEGPKEKSSLGLHEAIESAFSAPLHPLAPSIQSPISPSLAIRVDQQRRSSPRKPSQTLHIVPPPAPLSISASNATASTSTLLPSASIASPPSKPKISPPPQHREPSVTPSPEELTPGPSTQPDRDIARERANLVAGVAAKLDELNVIFSSTHGLSQFAGSIQGISRRNRQFLDDVAVGRFAHFHLTNVHLPQVAGSMPEFNPLRVLAGRQDNKGKGKEREEEDKMEVD